MIKPRRELGRIPFRASRNLNGSPEALAALGRAADWSTYNKDAVRWASHPDTSFGYRHVIVGKGHVATHVREGDAGEKNYSAQGWDGVEGIADQTKKRDM